MMGMATPSGGAAVGTSKDPRQLREKAVQSLEWEEMSAWARQTGFEGELKKGAMTGQMFRAIFEHLVIVADPAYAFPAPEYTRDKGKWEPEFMAALSYLRYPWVSSIDIKWLATVAAPHSWPQLLGMLHWLVELGKVQHLLCSDAMHLNCSFRLGFPLLKAAIRHYRMRLLFLMISTKMWKTTTWHWRLNITRGHMKTFWITEQRNLLNKSKNSLGATVSSIFRLMVFR
jgi:hypothetical protein